MSRLISLFIVVFFTFSAVQAQDHEINDISIIPIPNSIITSSGQFEIGPNTRIIADLSNIDVKRVAYFLAALISPPTSWVPLISDIKNADLSNLSDVIFLRLTNENSKSTFDPTQYPAINRKKNVGSGMEAYSLAVNENNVQLTANHPMGLFHGVQTIRQLLPPEIELRSYSEVPNGVKWTIPSVTIEDNPRFAYRGMHLDVGRHFMPVEFVKKYIDLLVLHKMNTFHWHLTEDQGWRIEIKKYPKLTEIGAWRDSTLIGNYGSGRYDNIRYGGFYTQEEIRDVVQYATDRFITVIPEIELPGHASAALAAYPEFGCTDLNLSYKVQSTWGIFPEIFCPTDETFSFLKDVLTEVIDLFPGTFIHIGGDEAMKDHWKVSQIAQNVIKREGLKDEHELQSYFIHQFDEFLTEKGRRLLGWDEILEGGLAPGATVMSWRGENGGIAAARLGHDAIMSPTGYAYLDYYQSDDRQNEPIAIGGFLPLEKVYNYDPIPAELESELHHHILGAQANVWTEYMKTPAKVEYMVFPRMSAMSEVVWSSTENKNLENFIMRLSNHLKRLDYLNVNYRPLDD
jgi:hexosaminidase